ncbi:hypothetical protein NKJ06_21165 [Mesorhizobium sp. M0293]|uniref:hypothetical protein n=1 Tax=Mesorhizobium sp. M0293 TaxID=2956930 RepID=UPI003338C43D
MRPQDRQATAELMAAGEEYLMLLGRLWRGDIQDVPEAKRERLIDALVEVANRLDEFR